MGILSLTNKLSIVVLLDQLCFAMMIVVFFPHITSLQGSQLYLGSIISVMSLVGMIWNPIIGSLGDTYGRKFILIRLVALSAVSYVILVISNSLAIIFIARVISAFAGPIVPIISTTASEILKEQDLSSYYSRIPAVMSVSFILGSLVSGYLTEFDNGYHLCYILILLLTFINIGMITTLPDTKGVGQDKQEPLPFLKIAQREVRTVSNKLTNIHWKEYSDIFSVKLCFELGCNLFYRSLGPSFLNYEVKGRAMGYVFTLMSVSTIVANIIFVKLKKTIYSEDKFGSKRLFHSAVLLVVTAIILSFSNTLFSFSSGLIPLSIARTIADSTFIEALLAKASEQDKGGVTGAFESITSFCGMITPIGAGILNDLYGLKFTLQASLVPTIYCLFLTYRLR